MASKLLRLSSSCSSSSMAKRSFSDLPEGMITEILVRLPVKSLLICKSVCKPWLSTISDPLFVKSQLHRAMNDPSLLVIKEYDPGHENEGTLITLDMAPIKVDSLVVPSTFSAFPVVGYCNGILCLENISHNDVYLWNPSIRKYKRIRAPFRCKFRYMLGFGYDSISNDYKVFCIVFETWTAVIPLVFVYSANADSWRQFQDPILKNIKLYKEFNVAVKGVLYFNNGNELISFDLHKEVFGLVPFPSFIQKKMSKILDFEGFVALFFESIGDGNGPGFDLWTLDDASHQVSWTKKCSIDLITLEYGWSILPYCYLGAGLFFGITCVNEDRIFLLDEHEDRIFNFILFDSEMRKATNYGLRQESVHATLKYTDTLVSLDGFQQVE